MRYFLFEEQDGGCDYTIGCGRRLRELKATDFDAAMQEATSLNTNQWGDDEPMIDADGEFAPEKARILAVESVHEINIPALAAKRRFVKSAIEQQAREATERAEYERLQAKFSGVVK